MKLHKIIMLALSIALLAGIIIYVNPVRVAQTMAACNPYYILAAFLLANISLVLRAMKWKVLLKKVPFIDAMNIQFFGIAVGNLTPGKLGEPVKSLALKMLRGISVSSSLPSILWERIFDVLAMLIFGMAGLWLMASIKYLFLIEIAMSFFSIMILFFIAVLISKKLGKIIFSAARRLPLLGKISDQFVSNFYSSPIARRSFILCFLLTMAAWFCDGMVFYMVSMSISPIEFSLALPVIMTSILSLSILAGLLSSLPGGAGSTEAVMIIMLGAIGLGGSVAASVALIGRAMTFYYSIVLGYVSFLWLSRRMNAKEILKEVGF